MDKKSLILALSVIVLGPAVFASNEEDTEKQRVIMFLKEVRSIDTNLNKALKELDEKEGSFQEFMHVKEPEKATASLLGQISLYQQAITQLQALSTPPDCVRARELAITWEASAVEVKKAMLEELEQGHTNIGSWRAWQLMERMLEASNDSAAAVKQLKQKYHIEDLELE